MSYGTKFRARKNQEQQLTEVLLEQNKLSIKHYKKQRKLQRLIHEKDGWKAYTI